MAAVGTIHREWQGGEHDFALAPVGHIFSLEEACKCGIALVLARLLSDTWGVNDVREPIRLGLIGGGLPPDEAMRLVKAHVDGNPNGLAPSAVLATAIVSAAIYGAPADDELEKKADAAEAEKDRDSSMTTVASAAPPSTAMAPR